MQADRHADRQADRQTCRQTGRQTDMQADRQTDGHKHIYTLTVIIHNLNLCHIWTNLHIYIHSFQSQKALNCLTRFKKKVVYNKHLNTINVCSLIECKL